MPSQGPLSPGTAAGTSWLNPNNALAEDAAVATYSLDTLDELTTVLNLTNFGFSLPAEAPIAGVVVRSVIACDIASIIDETVRLLVGGSAAGDNKAAGTVIPNPALAVRSYGNSADAWNAGLTAANINDSGFGVTLRYQMTTADETDIVSVDVAQITVYYVQNDILLATTQSAMLPPPPGLLRRRQRPVPIAYGQRQGRATTTP